MRAPSSHGAKWAASIGTFLFSKKEKKEDEILGPGGDATTVRPRSRRQPAVADPSPAWCVGSGLLWASAAGPFDSQNPMLWHLSC